MKIIIADNQDITALGLVKILNDAGHRNVERTANRHGLISLLVADDNALVILDYSLFDFTDIEMLLIINSRFSNVKWLLFSDDINQNMINRLTANESEFGFIRKCDSQLEITRAIEFSLTGSRYISQDMMAIIIRNYHSGEDVAKSPLTHTEREILILIAQGKSSREIAESRFSSINTIVTHRKNIFRKIGVNNIYEATRYALRMGIISQADYNI